MLAHAERWDRAMEYKEYVISEFVNEKGQWQARIRRQDGKHMLVDGAKVDVFLTPHVDSENEVIRIAKQTIDAKKVSAARD
jgi:folylpolyglutamate synthase/dihydropteroate synthase